MEDKEGNTRYTTEVVGDKMTMLGSKNDGGSSSSSSDDKNSSNSNDKESKYRRSDDADDLPF